MLKRIFYALLFVLVAFVVLNWQYFYQNIKFLINRPEPKIVEIPIERGEPNKLLISSIGVNAPIVYAEEKNEKAFQELLKSGVVHYPNTALPGESGNVYLFAHSSDFSWVKSDYKTVFALLPQMQVNEEIVITNNEGKLFRYKVVEKRVVDPNDLSVLAQDPSQNRLTLQTSYPIGTALKRYLVIAELQ